MYTQSLIENPNDKSSKPAVRVVENPEYEAEFNAKLARGDYIEAKDWMPDAYRKTFYTSRYWSAEWRHKKSTHIT